MMLLIVTGTSMLLAAIMSVIAWRSGGDQRRRSEARVAALSAEIHERDGGWALGDPPSPVQEDPACPTGDPGYTSLFVTPPARSASRPFAIVGAGALVFGAAVAIAIVSGRGFTHAPGVASPAHAAAAAALAARPIELVALGHERVGDQLTVRGVIRNPSSGAGMDVSAIPNPCIRSIGPEPRDPAPLSWPQLASSRHPAPIARADLK